MKLLAISFNESRRKLLLILLGGGILLGLYSLRGIFLPFIFGVLFTYIFNPIICYMQERGFPRQGAIVLLLIISFNMLFISSLIFFPRLLNEIEGLSENLPQYMDRGIEFISYLDQQYHSLNLTLPGEITNRLGQYLETNIENLLQQLTNIFLDSLTIAFSLVLAPVIAYYLLRDLEEIKSQLGQLFSFSRKKIVIEMLEGINEVFKGYFRGQVWISLIVAVLISLGLFFLRVRFFLFLGIVAGLTNLIPYIGPLLGAIPAILIALFNNPLQAVGVVILYIFIQQVESSILAPKIMSSSVGLHPLTIIFSLLAAAELMGIWGLLLAVPLAGVIKILFKGTIELLTPLNKEVL